jgi:uncharacterized protein
MCAKTFGFLCNTIEYGMATELELLHKYLDASPGLVDLVYEHSLLVADKALSIAMKHPELKVNLEFLYAAALLHDIGVGVTNAPKIHCYGKLPYICHGYKGREILDCEGLPAHGLVCERHTGTGLSLQEIIARDLPLPHRDMMPVSLEEQIICFSDLFYSKSKPSFRPTVRDVRASLQKRGIEGVQRFDEWCRLFH